MNNSATTRRISKIALEYNGNDKGTAKMLNTNNLLGSNPEEQFLEMKAVAKRNSNVKKWALTGYISPPKETGDKLSDAELAKITTLALAKVGVSENNQYRLDVHNSTKQKHIHFVANRIDTFGKCTVKSHNIGEHFGKAVREICRDLGIKTDIETGIEKRNDMYENLVSSIGNSKNFEELVSEMSNRGYLVSLSSNVKVGISGMRIALKTDINEETSRQYKAGYKLSEITNKLKISAIKQIFEDKTKRSEKFKTSNDTEFIKQNNQNEDLRNNEIEIENNKKFKR
ncbi:relaxase/mobilization nuclease domain-containing protein [Chryseobacterium arthrosphaerae]|uniref:relaxase/mobilization nuclease domain-containing protein n=1 Tax=Chryseobacterium arthrosphaerae TaxID=651561 RepID=UPI001F4A51C5|nr:relaxase/mobilization nuclease domain-containing protein [Chryseobacterium arthrosphaerae]MDG4654479.1 relaxase/mobilization nuclease domain-containing protein [Chryseobacterium arthrosphaerae]